MESVWTEAEPQDRDALLKPPSVRDVFAKRGEFGRAFEHWQARQLFPLARIVLLYASIIFLLHQGLDARGVESLGTLRELFIVRLLVSVSLIIIVFLSFWLESARAYEAILYVSVGLISVGSGYIAAAFSGGEALLMAITNILVGLVLVGLAPNLRAIVIITLVFFIAPLFVLLSYGNGVAVNAIGLSNIGGLTIAVFLLGAIVHYYRQVSFVTMAAMDKTARHDTLTGTLSRVAITTEIAIAIARMQRHKEVSSLLMLDLDHFKQVNDSYGHEAGDAVLKSFAETCRRQLRIEDRFGRLGGEEFAVLMPATGIEGAHVIAERLRRAVEQTAVPYGREAIKVTVSGGLTEIEAGEATPSDYLRRADRALYEAKASGRNRMIGYEAQITKLVSPSDNVTLSEIE